MTKLKEKVIKKSGNKDLTKKDATPETKSSSKKKVNKIVENAKKKESEKAAAAKNKPKKEKTGTSGKWVYPEDITTPDAKKKFRLQARSKIRAMQKDETKAAELAEYKKAHCVDPSITY